MSNFVHYLVLVVNSRPTVQNKLH